MNFEVKFKLLVVILGSAFLYVRPNLYYVENNKCYDFTFGYYILYGACNKSSHVFGKYYYFVD